MSTPAGRSLAPRPPEKGVFPLDHFNECKQVCVCGKRERERAIWGWLEKSAAPLPPPPLTNPLRPIPPSLCPGQGRLHGLPVLPRRGCRPLLRPGKSLPDVSHGPVRACGGGGRGRACSSPPCSSTLSLISPFPLLSSLLAPPATSWPARTWPTWALARTGLSTAVSSIPLPSPTSPSRRPQTRPAGRTVLWPGCGRPRVEGESCRRKGSRAVFPCPDPLLL